MTWHGNPKRHYITSKGGYSTLSNYGSFNLLTKLTIDKYIEYEKFPLDEKSPMDLLSMINSMSRKQKVQLDTLMRITLYMINLPEKDLYKYAEALLLLDAMTNKKDYDGLMEALLKLRSDYRYNILSDILFIADPPQKLLPFLYLKYLENESEFDKQLEEQLQNDIEGLAKFVLGNYTMMLVNAIKIELCDTIFDVNMQFMCENIFEKSIPAISSLMAMASYDMLDTFYSLQRDYKNKIDKSIRVLSDLSQKYSTTPEGYDKTIFDFLLNTEIPAIGDFGLMKYVLKNKPNVYPLLFGMMSIHENAMEKILYARLIIGDNEEFANIIEYISESNNISKQQIYEEIIKGMSMAINYIEDNYNFSDISFSKEKTEEAIKEIIVFTLAELYLTFENDMFIDKELIRKYFGKWATNVIAELDKTIQELQEKED